MSIKKYFENVKNIKSLSSIQKDKEYEDIESRDFVEATSNERDRFVPFVDFKNPDQFARFGLAEEYYSSSIGSIYRTYPYDGSKKEKVLWHNSSSHLDNYIFDNEYPRTTGYALFSPTGWGSLSDRDTRGMGLPATVDYVYIKGGPHGNTKTTSIFDGNGNVYDVANERDTNLKLDLSSGISAEFWMKLDGMPASATTKVMCVFDIWNGITGSSHDHARFQVLINNSGSGLNDKAFIVQCISGAMSDGAGSSKTDVGPTGFTTHEAGLFNSLNVSDIIDGKWHHYSFVVENSGSAMSASMYVDGTHKETITNSSGAIGSIEDKHLVGAVGAQVAWTARVGGPDPGALASTVVGAGAGKLSGSIDEFRYWKTKRTAKQVGRSWFTQVHGGSNTDDANTSLGVYYKFNEGITQTSSVDSRVLDYSGRISNGDWQGYSVNSRKTGSAMVSAGYTEFKDPIIYSFHNDVKDLHEQKSISGSSHDHSNMSSIYSYFPDWIREEQDSNHSKHLKHLVQIMSSYLDELTLQIQHLPNIKSVEYDSGSATYKPFPHNIRLLQSQGFDVRELFSNISALEEFLDRNEEKNYADTVNNVRNFIYNNIYNNLVFLNKSKGTQNSIRNLLHSIGLSEDLFKINLYADNSTIELKERYTVSPVKRRLLDFSKKNNNEAVVYQYKNSMDYASSSVGYISPLTSSIANMHLSSALGQTFEYEVLFPRIDIEQGPFDVTKFTLSSASIGGVHTAVSTDQDDTTWASPDRANFQIYAVKDRPSSPKAKFVLRSTTDSGLTAMDDSDVQIFETDYFRVYENTKWLFAVKLKADKHPLASEIYGSTHPSTGAMSIFNAGNTTEQGGAPWTLEFYGVETVGDVKQNEFILSATIHASNADRFLGNPKRVYVGAHRTNFTESLVTPSDVRIISTRVWMDYLDNDELFYHSKDVTNYGRYRPLENAYTYNQEVENIEVPRIKTLALHWNFETVTGSNASGIFFVDDISSGTFSTVGNLNSYGQLGQEILSPHHSARGQFFTASSDKVVDADYISSVKQKLPEILGTDDMIEIPNNDKVFFTKETKPTNYYLSIEKSMYQSISEEMLKMFATVAAFDNLIGDPVNRYRPNYKDLEKIRNIFFESVGNDIDFEKYVKFYKWFDSAVADMLQQLVPLSAKNINKGGDFVESHVLERNKYWNKFPTIEIKQNDLESHVRGINELTYNWQYGHAPLTPWGVDPASGEIQRDNCLWWKERAEISSSIQVNADTDEAIGSEDAIAINEDKKSLRHVITTEVSGNTKIGHYLSSEDKSTIYEGSTYAIRKLSKPYKFGIEKTKYFNSGLNSHRNKLFDYHKSAINFGTSDGILIAADGLDAKESCQDQLIPEELHKYKHSYNAKTDLGDKATSDYQTAQGKYLLPFSIYSSSYMESGYTSGLKYTQLSRATIEGLHDDTYGFDKTTPMQGPFTSQHVGGLQYRHTRLNFVNAQSEALNTLDDNFSRQEGWVIHLEDVNVAPVEFINQDFDDGQGPEDASLPNNWKNVGTTATDPAGWKSIAGPTPSAQEGAQGPQGAYSGRYYMYAETSDPNFPNKNFGLVTPQIDATAITDDLELSFYYHLQGQQVGFLTVQVSTDQNFAASSEIINVATITAGGAFDEIGQTVIATAESQFGSDSGSDGWKNSTLDLQNFIGKKFYVRFLYSGGGGPFADAGLDLVTVTGVISELVQIKLLDATHTQIHRPRAVFYRNTLARRPVNIQNIKSRHASPLILGNYSASHEIVQVSSGRKINNRLMAASGAAGFNFTTSSVGLGGGKVNFGTILLNDSENGLPHTTNLMTLFNESASVQREVPERRNTTHIFTERFSAPGGIEVNTKGYLDIYGEEFSPYNALPFRNLTIKEDNGEVQTVETDGTISETGAKRRSATVIRNDTNVGETTYTSTNSARRVGLNTLHRTHAGKFGTYISPLNLPTADVVTNDEEDRTDTVESRISPSNNYPNNASYHKVNRNPRYYPEGYTIGGGDLSKHPSSDNLGVWWRFGDDVFFGQADNLDGTNTDTTANRIQDVTSNTSHLFGRGNIDNNAFTSDVSQKNNSGFVNEKSIQFLGDGKYLKGTLASNFISSVSDEISISFWIKGEVGTELLNVFMQWGTSFDRTIQIISVVNSIFFKINNGNGQNSQSVTTFLLPLNNASLPNYTGPLVGEISANDWIKFNSDVGDLAYFRNADDIFSDDFGVENGALVGTVTINAKENPLFKKDLYDIQNWNHFVFTYKNGANYNNQDYQSKGPTSIRLYVNGTDVTLENLSTINNDGLGPVNSVSDIFTLGGAVDGAGNLVANSDLKGFGTTGMLMDEVSIWNKELTQDDVNSIYQAQFVLKKKYDNLFVSHPIPQSARQYSWISASSPNVGDFAGSGDEKNGIFGYVHGDWKFDSKNEGPLSFVSASKNGSFIRRAGSASPYKRHGGIDENVAKLEQDQPGFDGGFDSFIPTDFAQLNSNVYSTINSDTNTIEPATFSLKNEATIIDNYASKRPLPNAPDSERRLNMWLTNYNGPYQHPSWKQIRVGDHPVARHHKKTNVISVIEQPVSSTFKGTVDRSFTNYSGDNRNVPLTSKYKPFDHTFNASDNEVVSQISLRYTYSNNLSSFPNPGLASRKEYSILGEPVKEFYDDIKKYYLTEGYPDNAMPIEDFVRLRYTETIFPREQNMYKSEVRGRDKYNVTFWRNKRRDRTVSQAYNSQGQTIEKESMWGLDASEDYGTDSMENYINSIGSPSNEKGGEGELQNKYVQFHSTEFHSMSATPHQEIKPGALYARSQPFESGSREGYASIIFAKLDKPYWKNPLLANEYESGYQPISSFTTIPKWSDVAQIDNEKAVAHINIKHAQFMNRFAGYLDDDDNPATLKNPTLFLKDLAGGQVKLTFTRQDKDPGPITSKIKIIGNTGCTPGTDNSNGTCPEVLLQVGSLGQFFEGNGQPGGDVGSPLGISDYEVVGLELAEAVKIAINLARDVSGVKLFATVIGPNDPLNTGNTANAVDDYLPESFNGKFYQVRIEQELPGDPTEIPAASFDTELITGTAVNGDEGGQELLVNEKVGNLAILPYVDGFQPNFQVTNENIFDIATTNANGNPGFQDGGQQDTSTLSYYEWLLGRQDGTTTSDKSGATIFNFPEATDITLCYDVNAPQNAAGCYGTKSTTDTYYIKLVPAARPQQHVQASGKVSQELVAPDGSISRKIIGEVRVGPGTLTSNAETTDKTNVIDIAKQTANNIAAWIRLNTSGAFGAQVREKDIDTDEAESLFSTTTHAGKAVVLDIIAQTYPAGLLGNNSKISLKTSIGSFAGSDGKHPAATAMFNFNSIKQYIIGGSAPGDTVYCVNHLGSAEVPAPLAKSDAVGGSGVLVTPPGLEILVGAASEMHIHEDWITDPVGSYQKWKENWAVLAPQWPHGPGFIKDMTSQFFNATTPSQLQILFNDESEGGLGLYKPTCAIGYKMDNTLLPYYSKTLVENDSNNDGVKDKIAIKGAQMVIGGVNDSVQGIVADTIYGGQSGSIEGPLKIGVVNEVLFVSASTKPTGKPLLSDSNVRVLYPRTTQYPNWQNGTLKEFLSNASNGLGFEGLNAPNLQIYNLNAGIYLQTTDCLNYPSDDDELDFFKSSLGFPETGSFFGGQSPVMTNAIGETKWEAGDQFFLSGGCLAGPFYETYSEFAEELRAVGKDYSVLPEFRISEHMEYFVDNQTSPGKQGAYPAGVKDVSASISFISDLPQWLSLTGTAQSSSTQSGMFSIYSTTDFLKYFELLEDDHEGRASATGFSLKCKALMKFLPYDGFYPQDRTLQLANLFSRSYGPVINITGTEPNFRTALQPFFTPGIIYNSVKAGMAVDYPVYQTTTASMSWMTGSQMNKGSNQRKLVANLWNFYDVETVTGSSLYEDAPTGSCLAGCDNKMSGFAGNVISRIPFEAILNPKLALQYGFADDAGFVWSRLDSTASMDGTPGESYGLAMNNFLAETMDFFLENKGPTLFKSKEENTAQIKFSTPIKSYQLEKFASLSWANTTSILPDEAHITLTDGNGNKAVFVFDEANDGTSATSLPTVYPIIKVDPSADSNANGSAGSIQEQTEALANAINSSFLDMHATTFTSVKGTTITIYQQVAGKSGLTTVKGTPHWAPYFPESQVPGFLTTIMGKQIALAAFERRQVEKYIFVPSNKPAITKDGWIIGPSAVGKKYVMDVVVKNTDIPSLWYHNNLGFPWRKTDKFFEVKSPGLGLPPIVFESNTVQTISSERVGSGTFAEWAYGSHVLLENNFGYTSDEETGPLGTQKICAPPGNWTMNSKEVFGAFITTYPIHTTMYERGTAFGPPSIPMWKSIADNLSQSFGVYNDSQALHFTTTAPYTPPYFNGYARARITFEPSRAGLHSLEEIQQSCSIEQFRFQDTKLASVRYRTPLSESLEHSKSSGWDYLDSGSYYVSASQANAMQIGSSVELFGLSRGKKTIYDNQGFITAYEDDPETKSRWCIYPKWETPMLNFTNKSLLEVGKPTSGSRGMWHQYGELPTAKQGVTMEIMDVPPEEIIDKNGYASSLDDVRSLADLVGFEKEIKQLGKVRPAKSLKEAVVAIPFTVTQGVDGKDKMNFYEFPKQWVEKVVGIASSAASFGSETGQPFVKPGQEQEEITIEPSVEFTRQMRLMQDFVIPPKFDFVQNRFLTPFAMYIFPFQHTLTRDDVSNIWQNLPPCSLMNIKEPCSQESQVTISHPLLVNDFYGLDSKANITKLSTKTRWLVFKVKQKANKNYFKKTKSILDDEYFEFQDLVPTSQGGPMSSLEPPYSYNWPYDFFTMVELVKMDAGISVHPFTKPGIANEVEARPTGLTTLNENIVNQLEPPKTKKKSTTKKE